MTQQRHEPAHETADAVGDATPAVVEQTDDDDTAGHLMVRTDESISSPVTGSGTDGLRH